MREQLTNAAYGVLDYAAYPIGMLLVAPIVLRYMGAPRYGVWTVATAAVSMGSIIASGFGDANIQHVARQRGLGRHATLIRAVRSMIGINLVLGTALAIIAWMLAPYASRHLAPLEPALQRDCLWSLRLASIVLWIRTLESVCISTQRAFERYGAAVRVSIVARVLSLAVAAGLACIGESVGAIVAATAILALFGTLLQYVHLWRMLKTDSLLPSFDREAMKALLSFGAFSWLQAVSGVVFSQVDRLMLGVSLGAVAVASYALCAQMAQPVYGFAASGLHFLFPYLAGRTTSGPPTHLRNAIAIAFAANLLFVAAATVTLLAFGPHILRAWAGPAIAESSAPIFSTIVWSSALLGVNVTGTYALFALGRVQIVTWLNLAGGASMLLLMVWLVPRFGVIGLAWARLCYGSITLLIYLPLLRLLSPQSQPQPLLSAVPKVYEEA
ncbi:Membrane protein involved in the export of O-antigen and teichoic acid [Acidisarcina polymorpha]|uniref:Membrane protein involved in the export of O-antigen and teichoic acid n=1 Tax=Acidisarcina polymorpha TaxID=2211140 RepID=A0A2Z5FY04_9BACT|nr:oligosaccharide flippase family protein [Acidisarcina polymorpha]AXC11265.1 Membrane protein involved in the export of O-antigen and teichoic acid [Acidisarcina polymorpha]